MSDSEFECVSVSSDLEKKDYEEMHKIFSPLLKMSQRPPLNTQSKTISRTRPNRREPKPDKPSARIQPVTNSFVRAEDVSLTVDTCSGTPVDFFRADRIPPPTVFQCGGVISSEAGLKVGKATTSVLDKFVIGSGTYSLIVGTSAFTNTGNVGTYTYQVCGKQVTLDISPFFGTTRGFASSPNIQPILLAGFDNTLLTGVDENAAAVIRCAATAGPLGNVNVRFVSGTGAQLSISDSDAISSYQWTASTGSQGWSGFTLTWLTD